MSILESSRALEEAESRQRQIANSVTSFAIIVTALDGTVTGWNEGARRILGWSEEEMLGQGLHRFFTPEDVRQGQPEKEMACALEQGFAPDERWHLRKGGELFWASGEMTPLKDAAGKVSGFVKVLRDRTEHVQAAVELERRNATLESRAAERTRERDRLWRNSLDLLLVLGADGTVRSVNPAWTAILGYEAAELQGRHVETLVHADDVAATRAAVAEAARQAVVDFEVRVHARDGSARWIHWSAASEEGLIYANGRDVTRERQQALQLARTNAARLQLALAVGEMGVWEWDVQADRVRWLEGAAALHGHAPGDVPAEFTMQAYAGMLHPEDRGRLQEVIASALSGGRTHRVEYRVVWPDGSVHWLEARGEMFLDEAGRPVMMSGVTVDMTRRKRTERDLEVLAQASAELARLVDPATTLEKLAFLAVPSFADWCAVDMLDADGSTLQRVAVAHIDPQKIQLARDIHQRFTPDPAAGHGIWRVIRNGAPDWVHEVTEEVLAYAIRDPAYRDVLRELGLRSYLGVPITVHGRTVGAVSFITAESGRLYDERALAVAEDVARRASVAIENANLYQALQESDRSKDVFLATLAHELRNPLAAIASAVRVLELAEPGPRGEQAMRIIGRQVGQLSHLVDDLMDISRITTGKFELRRQPAELGALLAAVIETSREQFDAGQLQLSLQLPGERAELVADPTRLTQVFANLLSNAVKYTPAGGRITVALHCTPTEYLVSVRDTGVGIPPERLQDVFRMFTQIAHPLERSQGGLGIGLALVEGLVRLHGGRVEARSAGPGQGSEFVVCLPRPAPDAAESGAAASSAAAAAVAGAGCRILVVDDNVDAAEALAELLGLLGHEVVGLVHEGGSAADAALELRPDVVLLDIGLPGCNGYEVARRIRAGEGSGRMRLIALTGWGMDSDKAQAAEAGFDLHWVKPVGLEQLEALARPGGGA